MRQNVTVGGVLLLVVTVFASSICIDQYELFFFELFPKQVTRDAHASANAFAHESSTSADSSCDAAGIAVDQTFDTKQDTQIDETSEAIRSLLTQLSVFLFK